MPVNNLIQFRRGNDWGSNPILSSGEPGFDITNNILKVGNGVTPWSGLVPVNSGSSAWYDDINSGYISITGNNITNLNIPNGYTVGRLDLFVNGVKLVLNTDYTATNGTSVTLLASVSSGSIVQYLSLYPGHPVYLSNVIEDTSPQLGADLDLNSYCITGNGCINITSSIQANSGNFTTGLTFNNTGISLVGHSHVASSITDFNSSVSGLLPVKNIIAGTGISISSNSGVFTIHSTGSTGGGGGSVSSTDVMNIVSTGLVAGSGIVLDYNNSTQKLTISVNNALLYYLT